MAELLPFEEIDAGGVDSRSNPINLPRNRALRCLNWCPKQAGFWELRWGYSTVTMNSVAASPIHSLFPYRQVTGGKFVLFMSNDKTLKTLDTSSGIVTTPALRGASVASISKGAGFFANNRFHYGNGTDQKWYDGTTWRDSGLPALTLTQVQNVTVVEGVRELTIAQAASVTVTQGAGGTFPADLLSGRLVYVAIFELGVNEIGPATISVATGRIVMTLNNKLTVAGLPNLSTVNAAWVKLIAGTTDGGNLAYFFTNTATSVVSCTRTGSALLVNSTAHGLSAQDVVILTGTGNFDGIYYVHAFIDGNNFTVTLPSGNTSANTGAVGTVKRIVQAANATTSVDVLAPTQDTTYQVNQNRGLAASSIGGSNPGFQFYASIYNVNGGGHVGNRIAIGTRVAETAYRSNWRITGLPDLSGTDTEWQILIGRTGDGAVVPYAVADNAVNWAVVPNGQTSYTVLQANIDGQHELPTRNGIVPSQCNMFCLAGDYAYSADTNSPTLRRSGSFADLRAGLFVGMPEQSWAPNDIDTFPTAEAMTGMFEIDQEVFCGTLHDCALSVNLAGIQQWTGPWAVGIAGRRAGTKCGAQGFYWVTGDKQLCTFSSGVPVGASDEYEMAELAQIGDQYLSAVECVYYRDVSKNKEELRIEAQKSDGTPYTIIHDFKLKEVYSAPGSLYGQGYSAQFSGPLVAASGWAIGVNSSGLLTSTPTAIASSPNPAIMKDSSGNLWVLAVNAIGSLTTGPVPTGSPTTVFLNDPLNFTSWQIGVTTAGLVTTSPIPLGSYPTSLAMNYAAPFSSALIRDTNGKLQVYAGSTTGQLYQLYTGADDSGSQYTADLILLLNGGPNRPDAPFFDYYGDANVNVTMGRNLSSSIAAGAQWGFDPPNSDADVAQAVPGAEQDFLYRIFLVPPEVQRLYVRFKLTSHSADGNLNLNNPIHVPLESYGRIYELVPAQGDERSR
jgi:hypothetical protein